MSAIDMGLAALASICSLIACALVALGYGTASYLGGVCQPAFLPVALNRLQEFTAPTAFAWALAVALVVVLMAEWFSLNTGRRKAT